MKSGEIWRIRIGLLILLGSAAGVIVWLAGSRKTYRSWNEIRESGMLRAVTAPAAEPTHPRQELSASQKELAVLERFASDHGLELLVFRRKKGRLADALLRNWADVAFAELEPGSNTLPRLTEVPSGLGTVWWMPRAAINLEKYLKEVAGRNAEIFKEKADPGDLPRIRERRVLRVLSLSAPPLYYLEQNKLRDFEYNLIRRFADRLDLMLAIFTVPDRETLEQWLLDGRGDMGMAALPPGPGDKPELPSVFRRGPWKGFPPGGMLSYLDGFKRLMPGRAGISAPPVSEAPEENGITLLLIPGMPEEYAWFFRAADSELQEAADTCLAGFMAESGALKSQYRPEMTAEGLRLSPFDSRIKKYAEESGFDWLLIAAQIFQESRFTPGVIAADGGLGLMQLMPDTAREMNCANPLDPEQNIRAGIAYLAKQYERVGDGVEPRDRLCFALAAYNGGYGHLEDARRLARQLNLDRNRWSGHVEKAYELLKRREYYSKARYGFCRSDIIIRYVNEIMARYLEYMQLDNDAALKEFTPRELFLPGTDDSVKP